MYVARSLEGFKDVPAASWRWQTQATGRQAHRSIGCALSVIEGRLDQLSKRGSRTHLSKRVEPVAYQKRWETKFLWVGPRWVLPQRTLAKSTTLLNGC